MDLVRSNGRRFFLLFPKNLKTFFQNRLALHLFNNGLSNDIVGIILKEVLETVGTSLLYIKIYSMVGAIILRINPFLYKLFAY